MTAITIHPLPPQFDCETVAILKSLTRASRALGQLKGEISKIPNSQILIDTLTLQEAKDSNEIENIVTTDDEMYKASIDETIASVTAKEALNYANAIKYGLDIVKSKGLITTNDIKKIQHLIAPNHPIRKVPGTVLKNHKTEEVVYTPPQDYNKIVSLLNNLETYINDPEFHNIDSLIKRIDAKIAEKEASMQKEGKTTNVPPIESIPTIEPPKQDEEYENLEEVSQSDDYDKLDATIVERFDDFMKSTDDKKETKPSEPVSNIDNDSLVVGDVTDDEFYDDFFHDDNE